MIKLNCWFTGIMLLVAAEARTQDAITLSGAQPESVSTTQSVPVPVFQDGEQLTYVLSYGAKLVPNTEAGEIVLNVTRTKLNNTPVWSISGKAKTYSFFRWFYELNDTFITWLDEQTLRPVAFSCNIHEGKYRFRSQFRYDWNQMKVFTTYRNLARNDDKHKTMPLTPYSFDALALFYNLRNVDVSQLKPNEPYKLEIVLEDTIRKFQYRYVGRETKKVPGTGTFKTLKFICQIPVNSDEAFESGTEFYLWVSDDENKIPVYLETPLRVGSARVKLIKHKNLRYPFSGKIK